MVFWLISERPFKLLIISAPSSYGTSTEYVSLPITEKLSPAAAKDVYKRQLKFSGTAMKTKKDEIEKWTENIKQGGEL